MTFTTTGSNSSLVQAFQGLDVDQQLGLFWFVYTEMGDSVTPAAPGAGTASSAVAESLFEQVKGKSREEQLQIQRDLISRKNNLISREYGALSDTTKLLFWYLLATGMDNGTVVPVPQDYQLPAQAQQVLEQIKLLDFNQQITLFRDIVSPMGVDPNAVPHDRQTGL